MKCETLFSIHTGSDGPYSSILQEWELTHSCGEWGEVVSLAKTSPRVDHKQFCDPKKKEEEQSLSLSTTHMCFHSFSPAGLICPGCSSPVCRQKHIWESLLSDFSKSSTWSFLQHPTKLQTVLPFFKMEKLRWGAESETTQGTKLTASREGPGVPDRGSSWSALCPRTEATVQQTPLPARQADRHFHLPWRQLWTLVQQNNCPCLDSSHCHLQAGSGKMEV